MVFHAYATDRAGADLQPFEYDPGELGPDHVQIKVENCGICHSDLSMRNNDWGITQYPFVPGHEVAGVIEELGANVKHLQVGQRVGLGWFSASCMTCEQCMSGNHNLCGSREETIVGRYGGFADRVRCKAEWAVPLPEGIDATIAGPLFCGGITVFNPLVQLDIKPTDRVGVIGIGGLGHLGLQFANAWGCEVTAFTSSPDKEGPAREFGAHNVVSSNDDAALEAVAGSLDFIINTANADLNWDFFVGALKPKGRLHFVGVPPSPLALQSFPMIAAQRSITATPLGSPATIARMLEFVARHDIKPATKVYKFEQVNEAFADLHDNKPAYRIVLRHDD